MKWILYEFIPNTDGSRVQGLLVDHQFTFLRPDIHCFICGSINSSPMTADEAKESVMKMLKGLNGE